MQTVNLPDGTVITIPEGSIFHPNGIPDTRNVYTLDNKTLEADGVSINPFAGNYYVNVGQNISLTATILHQNVMVDTTIPVVLKMPLVRHSDSAPTTDEMYMNVTINAGQINVFGKFDKSGDWKILIPRINEALSRIGATFKFNTDNITFLV